MKRLSEAKPGVPLDGKTAGARVDVTRDLRSLGEKQRVLRLQGAPQGVRDRVEDIADKMIPQPVDTPKIQKGRGAFGSSNTSQKVSAARLQMNIGQDFRISRKV